MTPVFQSCVKCDLPCSEATGGELLQDTNGDSYCQSCFDKLPEEKVTPFKVVEMVRTCIACPAQWDGLTDDGKEVYVRYRSGWLSIDVDNVEVFSKFCAKLETHEDFVAWVEKAPGIPDDWKQKMINSDKLMREFNPEGKHSYDGEMSFERLKKETQSQPITWPDKEKE